MLSKYKVLIPIRRVKDLYQLFTDYMKKCKDDHVVAFGSMSAFFFMLSFLPFLIFLLTLAKFLPFSKLDIINAISNLVSFEKNSLIVGIVNEVYHKTGASVFTVSILTALWSSSRGLYSIVLGLNSVYDIDDNRNYFVLRFFSIIYTILFAFVIVAMLILWVFGNTLYDYISVKFPFLSSIVGAVINRGSIVTFVGLVIIFMLTYQFVPNRKSHLLRQYPGAIVAALGWLLVSELCAFYMEHFSNFSYVYGSMAGICILIIWMYLCMSMIFYGAEVNYFLENKHNYHALIRILSPNLREVRRQKMEEMKQIEEEFHQKRKENKEKGISETEEPRDVTNEPEPEETNNVENRSESTRENPLECDKESAEDKDTELKD